MNDRITEGASKSDLRSWYLELLEELQSKAPDEVNREFPGLVDQVTDLSGTGDSLAIGVSFTKNHTGLDYSIHRIHGDDDPYLEPVKEPVTETHLYVQFTHPPDPYFDAAAMRARLIGAVDQERRDMEQGGSHFADLWSHL